MTNLLDLRQSKQTAFEELIKIKKPLEKVLKRGTIDIPATEVMISASTFLITYLELHLRENKELDRLWRER